MNIERSTTDEKIIVRPKENEMIPFQFGGIMRAPISKTQQRQTFKSRDLSELHSMLEHTSQATPLFGSQNRKNAADPSVQVPSTSEVPSGQSRDDLALTASNLDSLRLPIEDFDVSSPFLAAQETGVPLAASKSPKAKASLPNFVAGTDFIQPQAIPDLTDITSSSRTVQQGAKMSLKQELRRAPPASSTNPVAKRDASESASHSRRQHEGPAAVEVVPKPTCKLNFATPKKPSLKHISKLDHKTSHHNAHRAASSQVFEDLLRISTPLLNCAETAGARALTEPSGHRQNSQGRKLMADPSSMSPENKRRKVAFQSSRPDIQATQSTTRMSKTLSGLDNLTTASTIIRPREVLRPIETDTPQGNRVSTLSRKRYATPQSIDSSVELPEMNLVREMQHLRLQIQYMNDELQNSEVRTAELNEEVNRGQVEQEKLRTCNLKQQSEIDRLRDQSEEIAQKVQRIRQKHNNASATLFQAQLGSAALQENLQSHANSIKHLKDDIEATKSSASTIILTMHTQQTHVHDIMITLRAVQLEHEKECLRAQSYKDTCDRNAGTMTEDRDRIAELSKQVSTLMNLQEDRETSRCREVSQSEQRIEDLSEKLSGFQSNLQSEIIRSLEHVRATTDTTSKLICDQNSQLEAKCLMYESQSKELVEKAQDMQMDLLTKTNLGNTITSERDTAIRDLELARSDLVSAKEEMTLLEAKLKELAFAKSDLESMNEARFRQYQNESQAELRDSQKRSDNECASWKAELEEANKSLNLLNHEVKNLKKRCDELEKEISTAQKDKDAAEVKLKSDFDMAMSAQEERFNRMKEQEFMSLENQTKSQSTRLARLEKELAEKQTAQKAAMSKVSEYTIAVEQNACLTAEVAKLKSDTTTSNNLQRQHEVDKALLTEMRTEIDTRQRECQAYEALQNDHTRLAAAHDQATQLIKSLKQELLDSRSTSTQKTRAKSSLPQKPSKAAVLELQQFAAIDNSSDSLSFETDDLNDFDFIHDTPPKATATSQTKARKEKAQDKKRRSLPVELVRNTQEEPDESFLQSNAVANRVGHQREEKFGRSRISARGYRKRKSN